MLDIKKLGESGIDYKPADFKCEVHFLGQIVGASNLIEKNPVFIEAYFVTGEQWRYLSPKSTIQTQTSFIDQNNFACFCHNFDLHLTTENLHGWPRMVVRIWKLDVVNKTDLLSYGTTILPNTSGYHEITFETFCLKGNLINETLGFFMDSKPKMNTSDPVTSNLDKRKYLITKPGPKVSITVEVILRNFTFHSLSGVNVYEEDDDNDSD